jgi:hypothetical protein
MSERSGIENTINRFMNSFDLKDWAAMRQRLWNEGDSTIDKGAKERQ